MLHRGLPDDLPLLLRPRLRPLLRCRRRRRGPRHRRRCHRRRAPASHSGALEPDRHSPRWGGTVVCREAPWRHAQYGDRSRSRSFSCSNGSGEGGRGRMGRVGGIGESGSILGDFYCYDELWSRLVRLRAENREFATRIGDAAHLFAVLPATPTGSGPSSHPSVVVSCWPPTKKEKEEGGRSGACRQAGRLRSGPGRGGRGPRRGAVGGGVGGEAELGELSWQLGRACGLRKKSKPSKKFLLIGVAKYPGTAPNQAKEGSFWRASSSDLSFWIDGLLSWGCCCRRIEVKCCWCC
uniref:Uncharacterized protein n=1 Tax=Ananas comosus var. bracteatus TaxID=296719 RepID=A0A6V7NJN2_ANACO|nr:unnamed protein product [Ananas comosus var. bracteatus]